jgi:hypothetical protein
MFEKLFGSVYSSMNRFLLVVRSVIIHSPVSETGIGEGMFIDVCSSTRKFICVQLRRKIFSKMQRREVDMKI